VTVNLRWLSWLVLGLGLTLCFYLSPSYFVTAEPVTVDLDARKTLVARLYTPRSIAPPYPVAILTHGIHNNKAMMAPLAVELARQGIAAIALDFGGFGESYNLSPSQRSIEALESSTLADTRAILKFVRSNPDRFDLDYIMVGGHSLGGATALNLAIQEPDIRATAILSIHGNATPNLPPNLFVGVGLYEQLNPVSGARSMLQQATDNPNPPCTSVDLVCGEFGDGTARQLVVSPTADHVIAPYDPALIDAVVRWMLRSSNRSPVSLPLSRVSPGFLLGLLLTFFGGIATGTGIFLRSSRPLSPLAKGLWRYCVTGLMAVLMLWIWGIAAREGSEVRSASNTLIFCYGLQLCSNAVLAQPTQVRSKLQVFALYIISIFIAFLLPALLCGLGELLPHPANLRFLPQFIAQWVAFITYNYAAALKAILFVSYSIDLQPSAAFVLLVFLESIFPSALLHSIESAFQWSLSKLRRPWRLTGIGRLSRRTAVVVISLIGVFGIVLYWRSIDGLLPLALSQLGRTLQTITLWLVLPLGFLVFLWRSNGFRQLERRAFNHL